MNIILKVLVLSLLVALIFGFGILIYGQTQNKDKFCTETYGEEYKYHYPGQTPYNLEACVKVNANSSLDIKYIPKEQNE